MKRKSRSLSRLELEEPHQHSPNTFNHKRHLFRNFRYIHNQSQNKLNYQPRPTKTDYNYVRDESFTIFDVISADIPYLSVEVDIDDMYPSKARSQRWPLSRKESSIPNVVWHQTGCVRIDESLPLAIELKENTNASHLLKNKSDRVNDQLNMDDLWQLAGVTLDDIDTETRETDNDEIIEFVQEKVNCIIDAVVRTLNDLGDDLEDNHDASPNAIHEIIEYDSNNMQSLTSSYPASPTNREPSYFSFTIESASPPPPLPISSSHSSLSEFKNVPVRSKNSLWTFLNLDNDDICDSDPQDSPLLPPIDQEYIAKMLASVSDRNQDIGMPGGFKPCPALCDFDQFCKV